MLALKFKYTFIDFLFMFQNGILVFVKGLQISFDRCADLMRADFHLLLLFSKKTEMRKGLVLFILKKFKYAKRFHCTLKTCLQLKI